MNEQIEFLKQIAVRLDGARIAYMITGSMAMAIYSTPRMTRAIDLIVEITSQDIYGLVKLFQEDCYIEEDSVRQAVLDFGMFNIIHNDWLIKADFIIRKNDNYRRTEFTRKRKIDIEGTSIYVVAAEDLILSKLIWGRDSQSDLQLRDVRQMIKSVADLDWEYLNTWATDLRIKKLLEKAQNNE